MTKVVQAAQIALRAFELSTTDHTGSFSLQVARLWNQQFEYCNNLDTSQLAKALSALRKAWWHNGSKRQRERVYVAAARLRFRLENL